MGCERYHVNHDEIMFSEIDDSIWCLCTFPFNDMGRLSIERVRSLAYLGAAVVLSQREELDHGYLPSCLPQSIRDEIDRNLGLNDLRINMGL